LIFLKLTINKRRISAQFFFTTVLRKQAKNPTLSGVKKRCLHAKKYYAM